MSNTAHSDGSGLDLNDDLLRNLGVVVGVVEPSVDGATVEFNVEWFSHPVHSLGGMPADSARRDALVALLADVLPEPLDDPVLTRVGETGVSKWFPLPLPKASETTAPSNGGADRISEPSGVYVVVDEGDVLVAGLGLHVSAEHGDVTITGFAEFPLVSLPSPSMDPVLFIREGKAHPVVVGVEVVAPQAGIRYLGSTYDTLHMQVGFDAADQANSRLRFFVRAGLGDYVAVAFDFPTMAEIVDVVLGLDALKTRLQAPIVPSNTTSPSVGDILVALGLLDESDGDYRFGTLDVVEQLTLQTLLEHSLRLLAGFRLVEVHDDPNQGLFVVKESRGSNDSTRYGLRLAIQDVVLSGGSGETADSRVQGAGTSTLTLQLGKGFESASAALDADGSDVDTTEIAPADADAGGGDESGSAGDDGNWTASGSPLGVSLMLLEESAGGDFRVAGRLELVSIGIDYANEGPKGLFDAKGFQFSGIEPRIYLAVGGEFGFGAACRLHDVEMPLDSTLGPRSAASNPVANNLIESKEGSSQPGTKSTPPARTKFSASAAYDSNHEFVATLYDSDGNPTPDPVWFPVEQAFGPVDLQKLGVAWANPTKDLTFLIDGGVSLSGLSVDLQGLSITFPLGDMAHTSLGLKGLDVTYQAGTIDISGGFVEIDSATGPEYDGEALIKAAGFTISALGAYAVIENHPSLFIFALIDVPLGGPPFFFVDGLAAGFGYNRELVIPTLDAIPSFPLVQGAVAGPGASNPFNGKTDPASALEVLGNYTPPKYGADWIAAGVRFSSFEMIQSFALLTVKFGAHLEIDLLGLSDASVPPGATDPIANAQLALLVTFAPDRGFIGASAKLTDESYVLSKSCHLTGGFAFYLWFADDPVTKAPAGQFVVTLGGYNSFFKKPSYYPGEPRLGVNWQVSTELSIKGGLYFALTPAAIMAGGYLDAQFQSRIVTAWFRSHADFLLGWKPFYYEISIGIDLGCTLRLPVLFATITITLELGVDLNLWGPSFGGKIRIHVLFFSFTIPFGSSSPTPQPIYWDEFAASFLPTSAGHGPAAIDLRADEPTSSPPERICGIRPTEGLLKDLSGDADNHLDWVLDPMHMQLEVFTLVPVKSIKLVTANGTCTTDLVPSTAERDFGVGPMAVASEYFQAVETVTIDLLDQGHPDEKYSLADHVICAPIIRSAPKATWDVTSAFNRDLKVLNASPLMISNTAQGATLTAIECPPDHTPMSIAIATLQGTLDQKEGHFDWSTPTVASSNPFAHEQDRSMSELMQTVADPVGPATRPDIIDSLLARDVNVNRNVDVSGLANQASDDLLAGPVLTPLGAPTIEPSETP